LKWCHFNGGFFFLGLTARGKEREEESVERKKRNEKATIEEEEKGRGRGQKEGRDKTICNIRDVKNKE